MRLMERDAAAQCVCGARRGGAMRLWSATREGPGTHDARPALHKVTSLIAGV